MLWSGSRCSGVGVGALERESVLWSGSRCSGVGVGALEWE